MDESEFFSLVGAAEKSSEHPVAEAIVEGVVAKGINLPAIDDFHMVPGYGIKAVVLGREVIIGTRKWMAKHEVVFVDQIESEIVKLEQSGKTTAIVAIDQEYAGYVAVADTIKSTSKEAIDQIKQLGLDVIMITGDNERTAQAIAGEVGIEQICAEVLPDGKADEIKQLQSTGKQVAMVGDGINDAPALATADIGIAIGTGTDIAIEAADITLIRGDLQGIADAIYLSKQTMTNIKQNLFWALVYNMIGIPVAALGYLAPWVAGAAMALSSVSVVLNALRLQKLKLKGT